MKYLILAFVLFMASDTKMIFDFNKQTDLQDWKIVNDGVMGGLSKGKFLLNEDGHALFSGHISLENYGGFSSVRYNFDKINVNPTNKVVLHVKGDGKSYQFRVKDNSGNYYSYIKTFDTGKEWEDVEIALDEMYPSFRGMRLDMPNFAGDQIEEVTILIANKVEEDFELLIDKIYVK